MAVTSSDSSITAAVTAGATVATPSRVPTDGTTVGIDTSYHTATNGIRVAADSSNVACARCSFHRRNFDSESLEKVPAFSGGRPDRRVDRHGPHHPYSPRRNGLEQTHQGQRLRDSHNNRSCVAYDAGSGHYNHPDNGSSADQSPSDYTARATELQRDEPRDGNLECAQRG